MWLHNLNSHFWGGGGGVCLHSFCTENVGSGIQGRRKGAHFRTTFTCKICYRCLEEEMFWNTLGF